MKTKKFVTYLTVVLGLVWLCLAQPYGGGNGPYPQPGGGGGGGTNSGPITLSISGGNVAVDASTPVGCATNAPLPYRLTMTGNCTLSNPTGALNGQRIIIEVIQDATGNRVLTMDTKFAFGTDITGITLTTNASKRDFITAVYNSTADRFYVVGFVRGF